MTTVAVRRELFQSLVPHIPKKVRGLFAFGFDTLVGAPVVSTRANARLSPLGWHTAKSKMWRLLGNKRLVSAFPKCMAALGLVHTATVLAVDFSDFGNGMQVLMFARQTQNGRALPVYFEVLQYPIEKDSQNLFVIDAIERLVHYLGHRPVLVFDRGFACPAIIVYLAKHKHRFIIRLKGGKHVAYRASGTVRAARDLRGNDVRIHAYGLLLRLVISDAPDNGNEPWYLLTNDEDTPREALIRTYYHRFEIEEFFRDAKHLLGLEYVRCRTVQGLTVVLWYVLFTTWLYERVARTLTDTEQHERTLWHVSTFRYVFEKNRRAAWRAYLAADDALPAP